MARPGEMILIPLNFPAGFEIFFGPMRDASKDTPLIKAVLSGNVQKVEECIKNLQEQKTLIEAFSVKDASGKTAFNLACSLDNAKPEVIKALFSFITPEIAQMADNSGNTAFSYAIKDPNLDEICFELLKSGMIPPTTKDDEGNNTFMQSILYQHKKLLEAFFANGKEKLQSLLSDKNKDGDDALNIALFENDFVTAEILIRMGCDVEGRDTEGNTRLMKLVTKGTDKAVQFLLQYKANINAVNNSGDTLFIKMLRKENHYMVRYLMEQGADISKPDVGGKPAVEIATELKDSTEKQIILKMITTPPPRLPLPIDYHKLCVDSLNKGDKETLAYASTVLNEKFLTKADENGVTPLHIAAKLGHLHIVEMLLEEENININAADNNKNTPLMYAAAVGNKEIVELLHNRGADIRRKNLKKEDAMTLAKQNNCTRVMGYIQELDVLDKMAVPGLSLSRKSFIGANSGAAEVTPEVLIQKGYALILEYYNQKDIQKGKKPQRFYVADCKDSFLQGLELLKQAKDGTEYGLFYTLQGHKLAVKCEKINGQNHIILMDSLGSLEGHWAVEDGENHAEAIENIIVNCFTNHSSHTFFYKNEEMRQTSGEICGSYALKDLRKMMGIPQLSQTLITQNWKIKKGVNVCSFKTPPEFMRLTQSYDMLMEYAKENKELAEKIVRYKGNQAQRLMEYALTPREKFDLTTPERIKNRNFGPEKPEEPEFVYKNHSIIYFTRKYISIIDALIRNTSYLQLKAMIETHDAHKLKIGPDRTVMSEQEERLWLQNDAAERQRQLQQAMHHEKQRQLEMEEKRNYEYKKQMEYQSQRQQQKIVDYVQAGILLKNDLITVQELHDYIYSPDNPWNSSGMFFTPSFLFSKDSLVQFDFDRIKYLTEVAQELRETKMRKTGYFSMPVTFSAPATNVVAAVTRPPVIAAMPVRGGLASSDVAAVRTGKPEVGTRREKENTQEFLDAQNSTKKRKVVMGS